MPDQCEHPWWYGPACWLAGVAMIALMLGTAGLCCGVMVRAYTWAAGD